jgi:peptidyl-dipeptidase Dcp
MMWHSLKDNFPLDIEAFEKEAMNNFQLLPSIGKTAMSPSFGHIFGGGYAAGYYGYKWAEVLDADVFSRFKEKGIFNRENAVLFREKILSKGGSKHPMQLYIDFMGRNPDTEALMKRSGLLKKKETD